MTLPPKPFYFIRHGETDWNKQGIIMGQLDIPLNDVGIAQALEVQKYFKKIPIKCIYTSPLKRAYQTAQLLNANFSVPLITVDSLKERHWGDGQGLAHEKAFLTKTSTDIPFPVEAESWEQFRDRVLEGFHFILETCPETPVVVGHGGVFVALVDYLGFPSLRAPNAIPFFFRPPALPTHPWFITFLGDEEEKL